MRKPPIVEVAERAPGYTANGESQFSRQAAHSVPKMASRPYRVKGRPHTLAELIVRTEADLRFLHCDLRLEDDKARRAKIAKNLEIKRQFLEKLRSEAADGEPMA